MVLIFSAQDTQCSISVTVLTPDKEEGGAHDTITSLAGAHMLQKFSRIGSSRDRKFRGYKNKDLKARRYIKEDKVN